MRHVSRVYTLCINLTLYIAFLSDGDFKEPKKKKTPKVCMT